MKLVSHFFDIFSYFGWRQCTLRKVRFHMQYPLILIVPFDQVQSQGVYILLYGGGKVSDHPVRATTDSIRDDVILALTVT